jgi:branched-chain amino acid aminotransferase
VLPNIFMIRDGNLITPPVYKNVLEGITLDAVMQLAHSELGINVVERPHRSQRIVGMRRIVFLGNCRGNCSHRPRESSSRVQWNDGRGQPQHQHVVYSDAVHGRLRGYSHWLTPVYEGHGNHGQNLVSTSVADSGSLRPQRIQACLMKLN